MEKLKILKDIKNPMFNRHELQVLVKSDVSPKTSDAEEFIAKEFSSESEKVKILKIKGNFGSKNFIITANTYPSKEEKDKTETRTKTPRKKKGAGAKK
jgi:ribosomal protein S24E